MVMNDMMVISLDVVGDTMMLSFGYSYQQLHKGM